MTPSPPANEAELLGRADSLAGLRIQDVAAKHGIEVPDSTKYAKGFVGQLMEKALGASAGNKSEPDFIELGIELKTIPVDRNGKPKESTFVCTIPLDRIAETDWEQSVVYKKLQRVLFIPIESNAGVPLANRCVGTPIFWSPNHQERQVLQDDWEQLATLIGGGEFERISGRLGNMLQVRPKAANSKARRRALDEDGSIRLTLPRGFYLRAGFTATIVAAHLCTNA